MVLEMYINGKLVESCVLSVLKIQDDSEREAYIQGTINYLLEKWDDQLKDQDSKPEFFIKGRHPFH